MIKYTAMIVAGVLFSAPAFSVQAQHYISQTSEYLQRMDEDQDGKVSLSEYQAWMMYAFDEMDLNADGVLEASELPGGRGKSMTRDQRMQIIEGTFKRQDLNKDGFLSAKELAAPPQ